MNKNKKVIVEVVGLSKNISTEMLKLIERTHRNAVIKTTSSPLILGTPYGFSNLLQRRRKAISANTRFVYAVKTDLTGCTFENGVNTGIPFNSLFTNKSEKWDFIPLEGRVETTA